LVVVENSGRLCALLVDEMVSKQEVVIKNLGTFMQNLSHDAGIVGGAILGDGNIALILDPTTLLRAAGVIHGIGPTAYHRTGLRAFTGIAVLAGRPAPADDRLAARGEHGGGNRADHPFG
jgi:hypothetical protein